MSEFFETVKEWAMKSVLGIPAYAVVLVGGAITWLFLKGGKGARRGGMFRR